MSTERTQISVSDIDIDVIKKDIQNMHLAVYPPTGRVRISSPEDMTTDSIRLFAVSKLSWIKNHIEDFQEQTRQPPRDFIQGESHYFQGQRYLMNIIEEEAPPKVEIRNKKYLDLYVRPGADKEKRNQVVTEWYREELKKMLPPLIEKWQEKTEIQVDEWGVRQMKTKWGSCTSEIKRILLNLELAKKSKKCVDYVVLHEIIHLKERLHSDPFIALLDKYMPNWKERREGLNEVVF